MEFPRQEYWNGLPFPSPGNLPNTEIKPRAPALQVDSLPAEPQGKPKKIKSITVSSVSQSICHEVMGPDAMILVY